MSSTSLDRRAFMALSAAAGAAAALYSKPVEAQAPKAGATSLAGDWRFALDREDTGEKSKWFSKPLEADATIKLPGILQTQGYGDEIKADTQFIAALPRDMRWYLLPQYAEYTKPGNIQVPYLSQPVRHFLGVAWYQREIDVPAAWAGKRVTVKLERARWETHLYVDDRLVGSNRSLVAPHDYDLGILTPGKHRLSIRVDNRMLQPAYRYDGHAVSDALGSTWNGIVGRIELAATSPVYIDDAQVWPNLAAKIAQIRVKVGNITGKEGVGTLSAGGVTVPVRWGADGGAAMIDVPMPNATAWSEFNPALQKLTVTLNGPNAGDTRDLTFGMREIKTDGDHIRLNGELLYFRGTHDGGGFPLTGYPAMDVATWKKIIGICKEWGLNGMRFHSWCPPEAAYTAADEMGFYMQPECGMWNSFDPEGKMLAVLNDETARLLKAYGNHASIVMLASGNEPAGRYNEQLPIWDKKWRETDNRRLYADGIGRYAPPPGGRGTPFAADYVVGGGRGRPGWYGADYETTQMNAKAGVKVPMMGHEIGQYASYPDFGIIDKFLGKKAAYDAYPKKLDWGRVPYMHPGNYIIMKESAQKHGLLERNKEIAYASGRFQYMCYKEEIEANMRTPSYSGYQMLDLHDYLGQGGALIGVLDAFWENKGYTTPKEFRQFANTTVVLARLRDRIFTPDKAFSCSVELAHYGPKPLAKITPVWRIVDAAGKAVKSGTLKVRDAPRGKNIPLGFITADISGLKAPGAYNLVVELAGTEFKNQWPFWVYPSQVSAAPTGGVVVTASWPEAKAALAAGGKVLFLSGAPERPNSDLSLTQTPIFWNRLMNPGRTWMLGLILDNKHGALKSFPTEISCDTQWTDLLPQTTAMNIDTLPWGIKPIVQPIDDWNRNLRLAMLFEVAVGPGKLMLTSLDLSDAGIAKHVGAPSLRRSVLDYMASPAFQPKVAVTPAAMDKWIPERYVTPFLAISPAANGDVLDPNTALPVVRPAGAPAAAPPATPRPQ